MHNECRYFTRLGFRARFGENLISGQAYSAPIQVIQDLLYHRYRVTLPPNGLISPTHINANVYVPSDFMTSTNGNTHSVGLPLTSSIISFSNNSSSFSSPLFLRLKGNLRKGCTTFWFTPFGVTFHPFNLLCGEVFSVNHVHLHCWCDLVQYSAS